MKISRRSWYGGMRAAGLVFVLWCLMPAAWAAGKHEIGANFFWLALILSVCLTLYLLKKVPRKPGVSIWPGAGPGCGKALCAKLRYA